MSTNKIGRAIKESCGDDPVLKSLLMDLLDYNMKGKSWYKEEYKAIIKKYAKKETKDED